MVLLQAAPLELILVDRKKGLVPRWPCDVHSGGWMFYYRGGPVAGKEKRKKNDGGEHWDNRIMLNGRAGMDGSIAAANRRQRSSPSPGDDGRLWCCSPQQAQVRDPRQSFSSVAPHLQGGRAG
ncbi:unnamed protein product [Boreogadus saida]